MTTLTIDKKKYVAVPKATYEKLVKKAEELEDYMDILKAEKEPVSISHKDLKAKILAKKD